MLKIEHVKKDYYFHKGIFDITLDIKKGSIVGILGRNGSGKSTLMRAILNLIKLDEGRILLNDMPVYKQYGRVAYIHEGGSYISYMNPKQYRDFLAMYYTNCDAASYDAMLQQFEIDPTGSIASLSKGQQMKVEIAAGLSMDADLYILDEPFNALDVYAKQDMIKYLLQLFDETKIILISTHNVEEIEQVIDRCIIMEQGKIVEDVIMENIQEQGIDLRTMLHRYRPQVESTIEK